MIISTASGISIQSTIIDKYNEKIFQVEYQINTNENWETVSLNLLIQINHKKGNFTLERDENGNWIFNGIRTDAFNDCVDTDISLTPFINTLPVRRLSLTAGAAQ